MRCCRSLVEEVLGEVLDLDLLLVLQLAVTYDLLDLCRQQLLALLLAHFDHLVAEDAHVHLCLQLTVSACTAVVSDESECVDQVFECVLLLVAPRDKRTEGVLVEGAAALGVHVADHLGDLRLAWVEVEAAHDCTQVISLNKSICILIEETEYFTDLRNHDIREHFSLVARAWAPCRLHHIFYVYS